MCQICQMNRPDREKTKQKFHILGETESLRPGVIPSGNEYSMNVQTLLRLVSAPAAIARAAKAERAADQEDRARWLNMYSRIYCQLTAVCPLPAQEMLLMYRDEDSEMLETASLPLEAPRQVDCAYAAEVLGPEEYAALLVPRTLLACFPLEELAADVLREYGWHGVSTSLPDPDCLFLYRQAEEYLEQLQQSGGRIGPDENSRDEMYRACAWEMELRCREDLPVERILEEAGLDFDQYYEFRKNSTKMVTAMTTARKYGLARLRENIDFMKRVDFSPREIASIYCGDPALFDLEPEALCHLLCGKGLADARYLFRLYPERARGMLEAQEGDFCFPPSRSLFAYAKECRVQMLVQLHSGEELEGGVLCAAGDKSRGRLYLKDESFCWDRAEKDRLLVCDFEDIAWVRLEDLNSAPDPKLLPRAEKLAKEYVSGEYIV